MVKNFYKVLLHNKEMKLDCTLLEFQHDLNLKQKLKIIHNRTFGSAKGKYQLANDFDAPLEDFNDYM